ncbi:MAG TPA: amino acid permease, partial [Gemmatales bacterium]|nr:amino acid permease [Gemmatales bacterium]
MPTTPAQVLPRVLSLTTAISLVVGGTIGTGIFKKPNVVAQELGSFGWSMLAWASCGIIAFFGTMALAELAALYPQAGGNYVYLKRGYGRWAAFLWGWIEFWVMRTGSIAALAWLTTEALLGGFLLWPVDTFTILMGSILVVIVMTAINSIGLSYGSGVQNVTTCLKIGTLLIIVLLPFVTGTADVKLLQETTASTPPRITGFAAAMLAILWAYKGWADLGAVAEDVKEPERNLPRAFGYGIAIIAGLYMAANLAYHLVLTPTENRGCSIRGAPSAALRRNGQSMGWKAFLPGYCHLRARGDERQHAGWAERLLCPGTRWPLPSLDERYYGKGNHPAGGTALTKPVDATADTRSRTRSTLSMEDRKEPLRYPDRLRHLRRGHLR